VAFARKRLRLEQSGGRISRDYLGGTTNLIVLLESAFPFADGPDSRISSLLACWGGSAGRLAAPRHFGRKVPSDTGFPIKRLEEGRLHR